MPSSLMVFGAAVMAGVASAASIEPRQTACADIHLFLAKGNNEPYPGRQGKLVDAVCAGLESCDYEDILYRNERGYPYCSGISEGTANGVNQIIAYNERCPNSKLVVSGYSQGAHVVGDLFGGGGGTFFQDCTTDATPNLPFNTPAGQAIAAIVTFGDVRHTANQPYNFQDGATRWGLFPRNAEQLANAATFAGVWRDYCHGADPICAGGDSVAEHLNYFEVDTNQAADFIHQKLDAADSGSSKPTSTSTKSSGPVHTTTAVPSGPPYGGNGTESSTIITVTDTAGATVTVITTVCPPTFSYVPNPTAETKPPHISVTVELPLPEATHSTVVPPSNNATATTSTSVVPVPTGGAASMVAKIGGASVAALFAAVALL